MGIDSIRNIDYVILLCEEMVRTRRFYLEVMKFPLEKDTPDWVSFRVGSGLLSLRPRGDLPVSWQAGPAVAGSAAVQLAFRVPPPEVEERPAPLEVALKLNEIASALFEYTP